MKTKIGRKNSSNLLVMIFAITMLFVTILGTSLAWFTDRSDLNGSGSTPYVTVKLSNGKTITGENEVKTDDPTNFSVTIGTSDSIDCVATATINSNIDVLLRVFIAINWQDDSINGQYGGTEIIVPNIGDNWLSTSTGSSYDKMKAGWLFYNIEIAKNATSKQVTLFNKLEIKNRFGNINGQVVNVSVYVEAIQANSTGMAKWGLSKDSNGKLTINS